jgi:hypothetical protein
MGLQMKKLALMILFSTNVFAADFGALVLTGSEVRSNSAGQQSLATYRNDFLGVRYQKMILGIEHSQSAPVIQQSGLIEFSGTQEKTLLSFKYLGDRVGIFQGFVGAGLGGYRDTSLAYMGNQTFNEQSKWSGLWTVDFGFNLLSINRIPIWLGPQMRIMQFQNDSKGFYVAGLLHFGVIF